MSLASPAPERACHEIQSEIVRLGPRSSAGPGTGMFAFKNLFFGYERAEKTGHGGSLVCAEIWKRGATRFGRRQMEKLGNDALNLLPRHLLFCIMVHRKG